jgi:hypothetical protein
MTTRACTDVADRVNAIAWDDIAAALDADGFALTPTPLLEPAECAELVAHFDDVARFRSSVDMARHRFGEGTYRYYRYPLPATVAALRTSAYPHLATIATRWAAMLGDDEHFPACHAEFLDICHRHGQRRPTPLVLRYGPGDWNALHQDLYGDVAFPLQLTVALSRTGVDFTGGETVLVEQRARAQSRGTSITIPFGCGLVFPTRHRPVAGTRGRQRTTMRHGVSTVRTGERHALGVIFHDAT